VKEYQPTCSVRSAMHLKTAGHYSTSNAPSDILLPPSGTLYHFAIVTLLSLSQHADRHAGDISVTVCYPTCPLVGHL